jgi:hypothetical protein
MTGREPAHSRASPRQLYRTRKITVSVMKSRVDLETVVVAVCVAGYAALLLGYVAHENLGFSAVQIRHMAMISADLLAMPVTLDFLRPKSS